MPGGNQRGPSNAISGQCPNLDGHNTRGASGTMVGSGRSGERAGSDPARWRRGIEGAGGRASKRWRLRCWWWLVTLGELVSTSCRNELLDNCFATVRPASPSFITPPSRRIIIDSPCQLWHGASAGLSDPSIQPMLKSLLFLAILIPALGIPLHAE